MEENTENIQNLTNEELLEKYLVREKYLDQFADSNNFLKSAGLKKEILARMARGQVKNEITYGTYVKVEKIDYPTWLKQLESAGQNWQPIEYFDENFPLMPEYWHDYFEAGYSPADAIKEDSQIYGN